MGFILGLLQMVLYGIYRKRKEEKEKLPEQLKNTSCGAAEVHPVTDANKNDAQNQTNQCAV